MSKAEASSVSLIFDFCSASEYMDGGDIKFNDKTLSWDGNIVFFNGGKPKKTGDEHLIPIQIKGEEIINIPESDKYTKRCKVSDLKNYCNNRGIIFILVLFDKKDISGRPRKEMYANILLPVDILPMIEGKTINQKVTLSLLHIESPQSLEGLCRLYIENSNKQGILLSKPDTESFDYHQLKISFLPKSKYITPPEIAFIQSDNVYLYGVHDGIEIPIIFEPDSMHISQQFTWDFNGKKLKVTRTNSKDTIVTIIQRFIEFRNNISTRKFTVNIKSCGDLKFHEVVLGAELILALAQDDYIVLNNNKLPTKGLLLHRLEEERKNFYKYILEIASMLDEIGISKRLFYTKDIMDNDAHIKRLHFMIVNKVHMELNDAPDIGLYLYQIGDLKFLLEYQKCDDGLYAFYDYFKNENYKMRPYVTFDNKKMHINKWLIIDPNDLPKMIINRKQMSEDLKQVDSEVELGRINDYVLALINSFDISENKEDLNFAFVLIRILLRKCPEKDFAQVNLMQIKKRMGVFNNNDKKTVTEIKTQAVLSTEKNIELICCTCILLEQFDEFQTYFTQLNGEKSNVFCSWPIYKLYEQPAS